MPEENVLIIEDDSALLLTLADNFKFDGYFVRTAADGEQGLELAFDSSPDLIVLDIMLPKLNGYEICRRIREAGLEMPIIMLTAKGQESEIVMGLNLGADDYVTKPFSMAELLARANALLRRRRAAAPKVVRFGNCQLQLDSRRLFRDGREVELTAKESRLLAYFAERAERVLTRDQILNAVWGFGVFVTGRSVDRCVTTLRKKVEPDPHRPRFIRTVREIGYRFQASDET
ncbi:MAG: chemotaxis protein CheY [Phycisphaerae bacterium SM23_33]|nr:MAG: chemotaxis protein CheY [Phycisphaerae bacterium SM23_33]